MAHPPPPFVEHEWKVRPADRACARALVRALGVPPGQGGRVEPVEDVYLDTADRALLASGYGYRLRRRGGRPPEATLKALASPDATGVSSREEWTEPAPAGDADPKRLPKGALASMLAQLVGDAPLASLARVRGRRTTWQVAADEGLVVEVSLDQVRLDCRGRTAPLLEVETELVSGAPEAFRGFLAKVPRVPGAAPSASSKLERALRLGRVRVPSPTAIAAVRLAAGTQAGPRTPVTVAAAQALARCAAVADRALSAARRGAVEGIHDVRTATRRARAALGAFHDELEREERRGVRAALRGVRQAASPLRDLDVLREALGHARLPAALEGGRKALLAALAKQRRTLHTAFSKAVAEPAHGGVAAGLSRLASRLAGTASALPFAVAGATRLPAALAPALARRARLGDDAADAPAAELHAFRIDVKLARYAAETFTPAFGRPVARFALDARRLQDRLGAIQDAEMRRAVLATLVPRVPARGGARRAATTTAAQLSAAFDREAERARLALPDLLDAAFGSTTLRTLFAHLGKRAAMVSTLGVAGGGRGPR